MPVHVYINIMSVYNQIMKSMYKQEQNQSYVSICGFFLYIYIKEQQSKLLVVGNVKKNYI